METSTVLAFENILSSRDIIRFYDPGEARTHDLHPVKVTLSLLSYGIFKNTYVIASLLIMLKQLYIINWNFTIFL